MEPCSLAQCWASTWGSEVSGRDFALYGDALIASPARHSRLALRRTPSSSYSIQPITEVATCGLILRGYSSVGGAVVASGGDYPEPTEPEYQLKHESWCAWVKALVNGSELRGATSSPDGTVNVRLSGDLNLRLLPGEPNPEQWYDDWYVKLDDA